MSQLKIESTFNDIREWMSEHKLRTVGILWVSGLAASLAYNWSRPYMKPSVKVMHARLHSQALTLAALAGAAAVEFYERKSGNKQPKSRYDAAFHFAGDES